MVSKSLVRRSFFGSKKKECKEVARRTHAQTWRTIRVESYLNSCKEIDKHFLFTLSSFDGILFIS